MDIDKLIEKFTKYPQYLGNGSGKIAKMFNADIEDVKKAKKIVQNYLKGNISTNSESEFDAFLENANINSNEIKSVKYWQTQSGEQRFSVVTTKTNEELDRFIALKEHIKEYIAPTAIALNKYDCSVDGTCVILNLFDAHIDKLTYPFREEDIEKNIASFEKAFDSLITSTITYEIDKIILPVGNDFWSANAFTGATKKGTPQNLSTHPEKAFKVGLQAIRRCIDKAAIVAPVIVPVVKGNHDMDTDFYLGQCLELLYEGNPNITVNNSTSQRKYIKFGQNIFGFAHGDKEKQKITELPLLLFIENKTEMADVLYTEFYLGDIHHKKEFQTKRTQDFKGCTVRFLRSVGTTDQWHDDNGYIGVPATAEAFVWTKDKGMVANYLVNI